MNSEYRYLDELTERYPVLAPVRRDIEAVYEMLKNCFAAVSYTHLTLPTIYSV